MKSASFLTLTLLAALPALGQNTLSWVSHSGNDSNTCTLAAPCATFQGAYSKTNSGGIIKALDAGDYGPITISKPIILDGNGVGASIDVTSGGPVVIGVLVNGAVGRVEIRSLAIHVAPGCSCDGIESLNGNTSLSIEDVSITGAPYYGVFVAMGTVMIRGVAVTGAQYGLVVEDATAVISDSVVRNSMTGTVVLGVSAVTRALIQRSRMLSNTNGLNVNNTGFAATAWISDCVISGNTTGTTTVGGGQIITLRNNTWLGNSTDGSTPFSISLR
jgi:hypothetical protein